MREIVRLVNAESEELLQDYSLSVRENEALYIQSLSYRSVHALAQFFSCTRELQYEALYLNGKKTDTVSEEILYENGIYCASFGDEFQEDLSIAENMVISCSSRQWYKYYSEKKTAERVSAWLADFGMDTDVRMPVWQLGSFERKKLSLLRAFFFGAKLTVLEVTSLTDREYRQQEFLDLIRTLNERGMAFLILASRYSPAAEAADRIQYIRFGTAVKEWDGLDEKVRKFLTGETDTSELSGSVSGHAFTAFCDPEWTDERSIWEYLHTLRDNNPRYWDEQIGFSLPENGCSTDGHSVVIPRTSYSELIPELGIDENLTILCAERISRMGIIRKKLQDRLARDFRTKFGIDTSVSQIKDLTRLQKKILSIERFVLTRPEVIILEDPYRSVHVSDYRAMRDYLCGLTDRGIRVCFFSRDIRFMKNDCSLIVSSVNCKI